MAVGKLTGPKKAAILLLALGEEGAAAVMQNLEEAEIQQVGYFMTRFNDISSEELDQVLEEFYRQSVISDGGGDLMASPDFIKNALSKALGPDQAKELGRHKTFQWYRMVFCFRTMRQMICDKQDANLELRQLYQNHPLQH